MTHSDVRRDSLIRTNQQTHHFGHLQCQPYNCTTATHCNTLQHTKTHCNTLQLTAAHQQTHHLGHLQCQPNSYNTLQRTTTHHNTLQHTSNTPADTLFRASPVCTHTTATHCSILRHTATPLTQHHDNALFVVKHTAMCCNTLQQTATH